MSRLFICAISSSLLLTSKVCNSEPFRKMNIKKYLRLHAHWATKPTLIKSVCFALRFRNEEPYSRFLPPSSEGWGKVIFSVCSHPGGTFIQPDWGYWGFQPHGGTPIQPNEGVPHPAQWGVPRLGQYGVPPSPPSGLDGVPPSRIGWVTPSPGRQSSRSTCYRAGSMPLAFTRTFLFYKNHWFPESRLWCAILQYVTLRHSLRMWETRVQSPTDALNCSVRHNPLLHLVSNYGIHWSICLVKAWGHPFPEGMNVMADKCLSGLVVMTLAWNVRDQGSILFRSVGTHCYINITAGKLTICHGTYSRVLNRKRKREKEKSKFK